MKKIINKYLVAADNTSKLTIVSTVYGITEVFIDTDFQRYMEKLSWCYERSKGAVYTVDLKLGVWKLLGAKSPKFYLQKYVAFLHTGSTTVDWIRPNKLDYRITSGVMSVRNVAPQK